MFLSWSGARSLAVAELLKAWLKPTLQGTNPWLSKDDISRGDVWFSAIYGTLKSSQHGIFFLTHENKNAPWMLFEAGAISKGEKSSRLCVFLVDVKETDVENPLAQFNLVKPDEHGVFHLLKTLNDACGDTALDPETLRKTFETNWPQFQQGLAEVLSRTADEKPRDTRSLDEILAEILIHVRKSDRPVQIVGDVFGPKAMLALILPHLRKSPHSFGYLRDHGIPLTDEEFVQLAALFPTVLRRCFVFDRDKVTGKKVCTGPGFHSVPN